MPETPMTVLEDHFLTMLNTRNEIAKTEKSLQNLDNEFKGSSATEYPEGELTHIHEDLTNAIQNLSSAVSILERIMNKVEIQFPE